MPIKHDQHNQAGILTVVGELSGDLAAELRLKVEECAAEQVADFVIDLEGCEFIDSEGLETLTWLKRRCEELFGQVKLVGLQENCRKILEITRLSHRFETHRDLPSALKTMP